MTPQKLLKEAHIKGDIFMGMYEGVFQKENFKKATSGRHVKETLLLRKRYN